jgi:hypothetical protein
MYQGRYKYGSAMPKHEKPTMSRLPVTSLEVKWQSLEVLQLLTSVVFHALAYRYL